MTFKNLDFKLGKITFDEFNIDLSIPFKEQTYNLNQDLFQVEYENGYIINIGWLPDNNANGRFILRVYNIENCEDPIYRKETRNFVQLEQYLQCCIDLISNAFKYESNLFDSIQLQNRNSQYPNFHFDRSEFQSFFDEEQANDIESGSFYYSSMLRKGFQFAVNILAAIERQLFWPLSDNYFGRFF